MTKGYNFWVDNDLQIRGVKNSANVVIELIKFMDEFARPDIPQ